MNTAELIRGLYEEDQMVLCENGTVYRLGVDRRGNPSLEFLPASSYKAGSTEFKTKGKGEALNKPVRFITEAEVQALAKPKMVEVPADELQALKNRITELGG